MKARSTSPVQANLNQLRRGATYQARTNCERFTGEFLGMEMLYGDFAILLRNAEGTSSIPVDSVRSIRQAA